MRDYENLDIEREYSKYPRGLKHYSKERLFENSLFDIALFKYKVSSLVKGETNDEDTTRHKAKSKKTAREILQGFMFRLLYEDRSTIDRERADRAIADRYIALDEREREEHEESESERKTET